MQTLSVCIYRTHLKPIIWLILIFFEKCKEGVIIINTSRGSIIKTGDLIDGLKSRKVGGACLDVFENEKTATFSTQEDEMFGQLYEFENVILTPHVAGWTVESKQRLAEVLLRKITKGWKEKPDF